MNIFVLTNYAILINIMMDGSYDISGDEQEAIYLRVAKDMKVTEGLLKRTVLVGTPWA